MLTEFSQTENAHVASTYIKEQKMTSDPPKIPLLVPPSHYPTLLPSLALLSTILYILVVYLIYNLSAQPECKLREGRDLCSVLSSAISPAVPST